jgi:hypothetical protein
VLLLTGTAVGPDPPIGGNHLPLNITSHPEKPAPVKPHHRAITYIRLTLDLCSSFGLAMQCCEKGPWMRILDVVLVVLGEAR